MRSLSAAGNPDEGRLVRGGPSLDLAPLDLYELAWTVAADLDDGRVAFHGEPASVLGDRDRIAQVLANLVEDALAEGSDLVEVSTQAHVDVGRVEVARDASSVAAALGLALGRTLVEAQGGTLGFEVAGGRMTSWLELPRQPSGVDAGPVREPLEMHQRTERLRPTS